MTLLQTAYFAGGCFWCITPTFREMAGISDVVSGYSGGDEPDPTYEDVKYQRTGHRETIRIDFDPALVSFETLLEIFLSSVDPFDGGGQFIELFYGATKPNPYKDENIGFFHFCLAVDRPGPFLHPGHLSPERSPEMRRGRGYRPAGSGDRTAGEDLH